MFTYGEAKFLDADSFAGIYQLKAASLIEALAASGGLQPITDTRGAQIVRSIPPTAGNTKLSETIMVDLHAVLTGGVADLKLKPGDVIYVPSRAVR
jgi:hypothetical protein